MARLIVITSPEEEWVGKTFTISDGNTIGNSLSDTACFHSGDLGPAYLHVNIAGNTIRIKTHSPEQMVDVNGEKVHQCQISHGDLITIANYTLMVDDSKDTPITEDEEATTSPSPVNDLVKSRIESRQKHYDSTKHILESLTHSEISQKKLMTLYKISNAISGILDLDHLLKRFLEIILEEFCADRGFIMLVEGAKKKLVPAAIISKKNKGEVPQISKKIVAEVFSTKESILCESILDDTRFKAQQSLIHNNIMSAMCVPLIRGGEILGLIHVDSQERNIFSRQDLDLLTKVSMQASIVIENARFYQVRQEFNRNLLSLSQATRSISSYLREDLIIQEVTKYAAQIFQGQRSYLFLKKERELVLMYATGVPQKVWPQIQIPQSFIEITDHYRSLFYNDIKQIPDDLACLVQPGHTIMAVPISISDETSTIGVLCVTEKANGQEFNVEDQQLLSILASHSASALTNAKFYQQIKNKEEEIANWNSELEKRVAARSAELKSTQEQLVQSEKMAAIGLLASGVAHEFNNIIASMYGFAQMAKKDPKYQEKLMDIVITQSKRGCEITENLLSFSKQKGDGCELVDVRSLVEDVLRLTTTALENEGIEIIKKFEAVSKTYLNSTKIQQVFLNIIINARQAIEKNGSITISIYEKDQNLHIGFQDTGKGIAPENLKRIFEPFYTTKGSFGGGTQPGIGIGLSLCYNIIRQHQGNITVSSRPQEGTIFTVILPVLTKAPSDKMGDTAKFVAKLYVCRRILIIEDIPDIRQALLHSLEEKCCELYTATTESEAIEICKKEHFDVVFLDIHIYEIPHKFDMFDEIKKLEPNSKIVIITGRAEDANLMRYVGRADGYLRKPFTDEDIYRTLCPCATLRQEGKTLEMNP